MTKGGVTAAATRRSMVEYHVMEHSPFRHAFVLTGPTASGKSDLGVEIAERLGAEIVAMDSMTLYRGMDIGTAKPDMTLRQRVPHHLLDVLDPWESANVAWWLGRATECCRVIEGRGRRVLFVGGTPLYLKALLYGLFLGPEPDPALRRRLEEEAERLGPHALHDRLARVDPVAAARLHPNDRRRIIRALEVWEQTGRPVSAWQQQWKTPGQPGVEGPRCVYLDVPRDELATRIDARVDRMLAAGWVEEARRLRQLPQPLSREARQALGYREVFAYLDGQLTWEEMRRRIQARCRQFAKRQRTWFRHLPGCYPVPRELTAVLRQFRIPSGAR
ncbi:MAG: tRNA (adenosine(37)-N6)-dimethylallyltransferase MiaA [Gemmataceae bacterium]|nr:tRNA (adenosine(37)-N6)-dimethylallyltransferase MiaA [Gemmataceae bacterium]MDW8266945.1 tRNA (adenosine(37)-N6)-dimethylallyltransferase MiaA [Gemmataceae bacterium]